MMISLAFRHCLIEGCKQYLAVLFRVVVATVSQLSSSDGLKLLDNPWDSVFGKNILVRLHSQYLGIYYYVLLMDFVFHICCFGTGTYR